MKKKEGKGDPSGKGAGGSMLRRHLSRNATEEKKESHEDRMGERVPVRGNSKCTGPEREMPLAGSRKTREATVLLGLSEDFALLGVRQEPVKKMSFFS